MKHFSRWTLRCLGARGNLKWEEIDRPNILHDEGEQFILQVTFSEEQTPPASYYLGLDARAVLAEADTLLSLSGEPVGDGYARAAVASDDTDWTVSQVGDDYRATSKTVEFEASGGDWAAVLNAFLTTTVAAGGKLIASVALSTSRTVTDGDILQVSMYISLGEA